MPFISGIKAAREKIVARSDDDRGEFLRKRGLSKTETAKIIEMVLAEEERKPESPATLALSPRNGDHLGMRHF